MYETYDSRGWTIPAKPADIPWADYEPKRIRPFRAPPRVPTDYWHGMRAPTPTCSVVARQPNDGPSAEWLAERNSAGRATSHGEDGTRIERALVADKSPLAITLRRVRELMRPPIVASNDNEPAEEGDEKSRGSGFERVHNQGSILPSIPVLLRAYAPKIETSQRKVTNGWHLVGQTAGLRKLTGLIFQNGELIAYGDDKGRRRKPRYDTKVAEAMVDEDSETAKHIAAQPAEDAAYTRFKAAGYYVSAQSPSAGQSLASPPRTARAVANDNMLVKAVANTNIMPLITVLPDGVAHKYGRLAGVAEMKGVDDGKTSAAKNEALSELERADKLKAAGIRRDDLDVIEQVLADGSFRTVGLQFGYAESSASKSGRRVVEAALRRISEKIAA